MRANLKPLGIDLLIFMGWVSLSFWAVRFTKNDFIAPKVAWEVRVRIYLSTFWLGGFFLIKNITYDLELDASTPPRLLIYVKATVRSKGKSQKVRLDQCGHGVASAPRVT